MKHVTFTSFGKYQNEAKDFWFDEETQHFKAKKWKTGSMISWCEDGAWIPESVSNLKEIEEPKKSTAHKIKVVWQDGTDFCTETFHTIKSFKENGVQKLELHCVETDMDEDPIVLEASQVIVVQYVVD